MLARKDLEPASKPLLAATQAELFDGSEASVLARDSALIARV